MSVGILGKTYPLNTAAQVRKAAKALSEAIDVRGALLSSATILERAKRVLSEQAGLRVQIATIACQLVDADIRLIKLERPNGR